MPGTAETSTVPSISAAWIKNNILAAVVSAAASLAIYGVRHATGVAGADAGFAGIAILLGVATILSALAGIAYGVLTGAVLQRMVPMLPVKSWIAVNAGMAVVAAVLSEISLMFPSDTPADDDVSIEDILLVGLILGGFLGAAIGGLQALVLRRAALGTSAWVAWSVVAFIVAVLLVAGSARAMGAGGRVRRRVGNSGRRLPGLRDHIGGDVAGALALAGSAVDGGATFQLSSAREIAVGLRSCRRPASNPLLQARSP